MKRLLLFCIILNTIPNFHKGQNTHIARHSAIDVTGNMVNIYHKFYYVEDISYGCCSDSINLVACDKNGNIIYKTSLMATQFSQKVKIKITKDKCLLFCWRSNQSCDVLRYSNYITKIDTAGQIVFNKLITFTQKYFPNYIVDFVGAADTSIYACSRDTIYHYSKNGLLLSLQHYSNSPINCIENLSNGNIIINSGISHNCLNSIVSSNLNAVSQYTCPFQISKFSQSANGLLIASQYGQLLRFSSNMAQTYTSQIYCNDFALRSDSIFFVGSNVNSSPFYAVANSSLTIIYSNISSLTNYSPTGIVATSDGVKSIGFGSSATQLQMSFTSFFNLNTLGQFNSQPDLAVTNASLTNFSPWNNSLSQYLVCWMDVMVKNKGQQSIQKFYLNNLTPMSWCWATLHKEYNLNLSPGDSAIVQTGSFVIGYNNGTFNAGLASPITATPCIFSSIPNNQLDSDISNDSFCKTFTVGFVGITENNLTNHIKIFPNPFENIITVQSQEKVLKLSLQNALGQEILSMENPERHVEISTAHLNAGIYLLKVETENGINFQKIIKQ